MIDLVFWAPVMAGGALAGASACSVRSSSGCGFRSSGCASRTRPWPAPCSAAWPDWRVSTSCCPRSPGILTALVLGLLNPQRAHLDDNTVLSFLFSATMGLAFLGIGLYGILGRRTTTSAASSGAA